MSSTTVQTSHPIAARSIESNVTPLWKSQRLISTRPIGYVRRGVYPSPRQGRISRSEPSSSRSKRVFDVILASLALIFFAPLFFGIVIAIKATSKGSVFFRQYRYGYRNRLFKIYKFRSMHVADGDPTGVKQSVRDDPRVTAVGRVLRRTSLDEIPQLINVIKGDMSLVGPRPHVPRMLAAGIHYEDLVPYYFQRHIARPGITGLAQVSGCRGSTVEPDLAIKRINYDLNYIEKWTFRMDIRLLARTVRREFLSGSGS